jgi:hypothetical protein
MKKIFSLGILIIGILFFIPQVVSADCASYCIGLGQGYIGGECPSFSSPSDCCAGTDQCPVYREKCSSGQRQSWFDTGGSNGCSIWSKCYCYKCLVDSSCVTTEIPNIDYVYTDKDRYVLGETAVVTWQSTGIPAGKFCVRLMNANVPVDALPQCNSSQPKSWTLGTNLSPGPSYRFQVCQANSFDLGCENEQDQNRTAYSSYFPISNTSCQSGQDSPHKVCQGTTCVSVPGCGVTNCQSDNWCVASTQTCSQKGGSCCTGSNTCSSGKISGASDCAECCGSVNNCSGGGLPPGPGGPVEIQNPIQAGSFEDIINSIINFIFKIAIILAPLMVIVSGFLFVTSAGDPKKITQAKNILIYAAVGLLIVLLSKGILAIIKQILGTT